MPSTEIALPNAVGVSSGHRVGQGTSVEMSRAVAEVHAAMSGARQFPRDELYATQAMENSCRQLYVAERAFFRIRRGSEAVTGPSVHLARELARCWGHIQHGIVEMRRDDEHGQSEMQAYAWDVQTGTRLAHTFIVPHKRDKKNKQTNVTEPEALTTMQEIYESNANNGARRLRECIFGVLPPWFTERAKELCQETNRQGDGTPLAERITNAVAGFQEIGVDQKRLERKLAMPRPQWTALEVSLLGTVYRAIKAGETTKELEFPDEQAQIRAADITSAQPAAQQQRDATPAAPTETQKPVDAEPSADEVDEWEALDRARDAESADSGSEKQGDAKGAEQ